MIELDTGYCLPRQCFVVLVLNLKTPPRWAMFDEKLGDRQRIDLKELKHTIGSMDDSGKTDDNGI